MVSPDFDDPATTDSTMLRRRRSWRKSIKAFIYRFRQDNKVSDIERQQVFVDLLNGKSSRGLARRMLVPIACVGLIAMAGIGAYYWLLHRAVVTKEQPTLAQIQALPPPEKIHENTKDMDLPTPKGNIQDAAPDQARQQLHGFMDGYAQQIQKALAESQAANQELLKTQQEYDAKARKRFNEILSAVNKGNEGVLQEAARLRVMIADLDKLPSVQMASQAANTPPKLVVALAKAKSQKPKEGQYRPVRITISRVLTEAEAKFYKGQRR